MNHQHARTIDAPRPPDRRHLLKWTTMQAASGLGPTAALAQGVARPERTASAPAKQDAGELHKGMLGFMLRHEQFPVPTLVQLGTAASRAGFHLLATSDHLQPWQANEGHAGDAWVTMGAPGAHIPGSWMGTTATCPTLRYNPAVVAEAFASLSLLQGKGGSGDSARSGPPRNGP